MANIDGQLDGIGNHHASKLLGISVRDFLDEND